MQAAPGSPVSQSHAAVAEPLGGGESPSPGRWEGWAQGLQLRGGIHSLSLGGLKSLQNAVDRNSGSGN